jgi:hypothetical protein
MKKSLISVLFLAQFISTASFAQTLLTCTSNKGDGDQIETLTLSENNGNYEIKVTYSPVAAALVGDEETVPVIQAKGESATKQFVLEQSSKGDDLTSLVANLDTKQASLVIQTSRNGLTPMFLNCK